MDEFINSRDSMGVFLSPKCAYDFANIALNGQGIYPSSGLKPEYGMLPTHKASVFVQYESGDEIFGCVITRMKYENNAVVEEVTAVHSEKKFEEYVAVNGCAASPKLSTVQDLKDQYQVFGAKMDAVNDVKQIARFKADLDTASDAAESTIVNGRAGSREAPNISVKASELKEFFETKLLNAIEKCRALGVDPDSIEA